jgi:hypothetical protein
LPSGEPFLLKAPPDLPEGEEKEYLKCNKLIIRINEEL